MKGKGGGDWCSAINCNKSRKKNPNKSFFKFPKDPERCSKWVVNARRKDNDNRSVEYLSKNLSLCSDHFEERQFMNSSKQRLIWNAVPTIFDISNPPPQITTKRKLPAPRVSQQSKRKLPAKTESQPSPKILKKNTSVLQASAHSVCTEKSVSFCEDSETADLPLPRDTTCHENVSSQPKEQAKLLVKRILWKSNSKVYRMKKKCEGFQQKACKRTITQQDLIVGSRKYLTAEAHAIYVAQIENFTRKKKRFKDEVIKTALAIFYSSPKAYRILLQIFSLPSIRTLQRYLKKIPFKPGISQPVLKILEEKAATMTSQEKLCVICVDEMSLKAALSYNASEDKIEGLEDYGHLGTSKFLANHVCVIMLKGLTNAWKQPLGYFLVADTIPSTMLKEIITDVIHEVQQIGLIVKSVICDQGPTNRGCFRMLDITENKPYVEICGEKIYFLYDPPHLMKSVRNNLRKHDFVVNNNFVKWKYILSFYQKDSKEQTRMAPKLTDKHFFYNSFGAMRVNLAVQVLSSTVAAGMMTYCQSGHLPVEASNTAIFIDRLDKLFDCMNSRRKFSDKAYRGAIMPNSVHIPFLKECLEVLKEITVPTAKNKIACLNGWILTIVSTIALWEDINLKYGVNMLKTYRLNQDSLENLFAVLRQKGGCSDTPTPVQCGQNMKKIMVTFLLKPPKSSNCKPDEDVLFSSISSLIPSPVNIPNTKSTLTKVTLPHIESSAKVISSSVLEDSHDSFLDNNFQVAGLPESVGLLGSLPKQNIDTYISGYFAYNLLKKHKCEDCKLELLTGNSLTSESQLFMLFKAHAPKSGDFGGLSVPAVSLVNSVQNAEEVFLRKFDDILHQSYLKKKLVVLLKKEVQFLPKVCVDIEEKFWNFFASCRIYWAIRFLNRDIVQDRKLALRKNRKLIKISHM